jgi:hypothetical protein
VIQVSRSARIVGKSLGKLLQERLDRRNAAAHPSGIVFSQLQAEEYIHGLVENVILKL